jgi:hypothetical protein
MEVLVSGYQSIDMRYIMFFVKFYAGLSISVLRNKQLFKKKKKKMEVKSLHFHLGKGFNFFGPHFFCERDRHPLYLSTDPEKT